jgi:hypothetical protein
MAADSADKSERTGRRPQLCYAPPRTQVAPGGGADIRGGGASWAAQPGARPVHVGVGGRFPGGLESRTGTDRRPLGRCRGDTLLTGSVLTSEAGGWFVILFKLHVTT